VALVQPKTRIMKQREIKFLGGRIRDGTTQTKTPICFYG
jgi:hypothetical protein